MNADIKKIQETSDEMNLGVQSTLVEGYSDTVLKEKITNIRGKLADYPTLIEPWSLTVAIPPGGWDHWAEFAVKHIPECSSLVTAMAEHAAGFTLSGGDDKVREVLDSFIFLYNYQLLALKMNVIYLTYGRMLVDIDFSRSEKHRQIKLPNPISIDIFRYNQKDIDRMLQKTGMRVFEGRVVMDKDNNIQYVLPTDPSSDTIIGYAQAQPINKLWTYFPPEQFETLFRLQDIAGEVNGLSLLKPVWVQGNRKIRLETKLDLIADLIADPQKLWIIGNDKLPLPPGQAGNNMIQFVKDLVENRILGEDHYMPDWVEMKPITEGFSSAQVVEGTIKMATRGVIGGMGGFESMVTGESSNRTTTTTQERLFDERVNPVRWATTPLHLHIFAQYLAKFHPELVGKDLPQIVWRDLTIETSFNNRVSLSRGVSSGWISINEARAVEGLPQLAADYMLLPLNVNVVKLGGEEPEFVEVPGPDSSAAQKKAPGRDTATIDAVRALTPEEILLWERSVPEGVVLVEKEFTMALMKELIKLEQGVNKWLDSKK